MAKILSAKIKGSSPIDQSLYSQFKKITLDTTLRKLSGMLDRDHFALMVHSSRLYQGSVSEREVCIGILTQIDLLNYMLNANKKQEKEMRGY